jgi:hypothetical protein
MTQFHEGQEVEVLAWRKAKITALLRRITDLDDGSRLIDTFPDYEAQFSDGTRAVLDAEHIRAAPFENSGLNEELQKYETSKQELFDVGNGLAVSFNPRGRFHGWLFRQHPDGQYVSVRKLNKVTGTEP